MMAFVVFKSIPYEGWSRPLRVFLNEIDADIFCKENGSKFDYESIKVQGECDIMTSVARKHTPGPWTVSNGTDVFPDIDVDGVAQIADCSLSNAIDFEEEKANARLIASAPELLLALKGCLRELEAIFSKPAPQGAIAKARAAVYKAEVGN